MRHPRLPLLLVTSTILALACSDEMNPPGADAGLDGPVVGAEAGPDLRQPDRALPDLALPDVSPPDVSPPDVSPPDVPTPDAPTPDLPLPDLAPPDLPPPANDTCAKAKLLTLVGGKISEQGDTSSAKNEFGAAVTCGGFSPYDGPQRYYRLKLTAGKLYSIKVTPGPTFDPALYALPASSGCTSTGVSAGCKGQVTDIIGKGTSGVETLTLKPSATEDWLLVVDAYSATEKGPFTLEVSEAQPASNDKCAKALVMPLAGGKASATGDTSTATNEYGTSIACGTSYDYDGPQLYYRIVLPANKTFKITATPKTAWDLSAYAFTDATCTASIITSQCAGWIADRAGKGKAESFFITTQGTQQNYILAVDSYAAPQKGSFELKVEEFAVAKNGTCVTAQQISPAGAKVAASGNISGVKDEYPGLKCGASPALSGPQLYYSFRAKSSHAYRLRLQADFPAHLYLTEKNKCGDATKMAADCSGGGVQGDYWGPTTSGGWVSGYFTKTAGIDYLVGVESTTAPAAGTFKLQLAELPPAANEVCSGAVPLTLSSGQARVSGDTFVRKDEYATLKCGGATALSGPQLYYSFKAAVGKVYRVALFPQFKGQLYIFPKAACGSVTTVEAACASNGKAGPLLSSPISPSSGGELIFSPATAGDHIIAVDSGGSTEAGAFDLTVSEMFLPMTHTFNAPISWDFEQSCQNLLATGDWECGSLDFAASPACGKGAAPPSVGHTGKGVWGTRLNDCYAARGNNAHTGCKATSSADDSKLSFQVALPSTWTKATLTYWAWDDSHTPDDWSEVRLDDVPVPATQTCSLGSYSPPTAWVQHTVDLTAKLGKSVLVSFHFSADTITNLAGLYLDDISVSGK